VCAHADTKACHLQRRFGSAGCELNQCTHSHACQHFTCKGVLGLQGSSRNHPNTFVHTLTQIRQHATCKGVLDLWGTNRKHTSPKHVRVYTHAGTSACHLQRRSGSAGYKLTSPNAQFDITHMLTSPNASVHSALIPASHWTKATCIRAKHTQSLKRALV